MRYVCAKCGADASKDGCTRCGGLTFDMDDPEGRKQLEDYRALTTRFDTSRTLELVFFLQWVACMALIFGLEHLIERYELTAWLDETSFYDVVGFFVGLLLFLTVPAYFAWRRRRLPPDLRRLEGDLQKGTRSVWAVNPRDVTVWLLLVCILSRVLPQEVIEWLQFDPEAVRQGKNLWTLVTAVLVQPNLVYVDFIGPFLVLWGRELQPSAGRWGTLLAFLGGGLAATLGHLWKGATDPLMGAAAGIIGIGGCLVMLDSSRQLRTVCTLYDVTTGVPRLPVWISVPFVMLAYHFGYFVLTDKPHLMPWLEHAAAFCFGLGLGAVLRVRSVWKKRAASTTAVHA